MKHSYIDRIEKLAKEFKNDGAVPPNTEQILEIIEALRDLRSRRKEK